MVESLDTGFHGREELQYISDLVYDRDPTTMGARHKWTVGMAACGLSSVLPSTIFIGSIFSCSHSTLQNVILPTLALTFRRYMYPAPRLYWFRFMECSGYVAFLPLILDMENIRKHTHLKASHAQRRLMALILGLPYYIPSLSLDDYDRQGRTILHTAVFTVDCFGTKSS